MIQSKQVLDEKQQLIPHFKNVSRSWETMKDYKEMYATNLNIEYFVRRHPNQVHLFRNNIQIETSEDISSQTASSGVVDFLSEPALVKHGIAVINFLEAVIEFINGNEDSKPVLYVLGRRHKDENVTEKMFIEMKNALMEIIKPDLPKDQWVSWAPTLEYIYANYIFKGMNINTMTDCLSKNFKDYVFHGIVGSGTFSTCYKVKNKNGVISIWKAIDYGWMLHKDKEVLMKEIATLSATKHPNIVKFYSFTDNRLTCNVYVQMEFCSGGSLMEFIMEKERNKSFVEESFIWVIHWSITPSHIFLDQFSNLKLGGFSINENLFSEYGIPIDALSHLNLLYTSPEILCGQKYTQKALIWSLGCLIHELSTLHHPYSGSNSSEIMLNIFSQTRIRIPCLFSDELQKIIDAMLISNPEARPTIEDMEHCSTAKSLPVICGVDRLFISQEKESMGKENMKSKCKLRPCRNCLNLEQELNKMKLKEASMKLKECRLKERELSVVKREMKVSHLMNKSKEKSVTLSRVHISPLVNHGHDTESYVEHNSILSRNLGPPILQNTVTKLDPNKIRRPEFGFCELNTHKTVHFQLQRP